jgi:hypothetical protein
MVIVRAEGTPKIIYASSQGNKEDPTSSSSPPNFVQYGLLIVVSRPTQPPQQVSFVDGSNGWAPDPGFPYRGPNDDANDVFGWP